MSHRHQRDKKKTSLCVSFQRACLEPVLVLTARCISKALKKQALSSVIYNERDIFYFIRCSGQPFLLKQINFFFQNKKRLRLH